MPGHLPSRSISCTFVLRSIGQLKRFHRALTTSQQRCCRVDPFRKCFAMHQVQSPTHILCLGQKRPLKLAKAATRDRPQRASAQAVTESASLSCCKSSACKSVHASMQPLNHGSSSGQTFLTGMPLAELWQMPEPTYVLLVDDSPDLLAVMAELLRH